MRSNLQIEASRVNGSKSRGPVTEEGKVASSRNAWKHGLLSETILLYGEEEETFHAFNMEFIAALQPTNPVEKDLVDTMAVARWRRMRIWNLEKSTLELQMDREDDKHRSPACTPEILASLAFSSLADNSRSLDLINRYESRYDRQYHRALRTLLDLRKNPQPTPPEDGPAATSRGSEPTPIDASHTTDSAKRTQRPLQGRWLQPATRPAPVRSLWLPSFTPRRNILNVHPLPPLHLETIGDGSISHAASGPR